MSNFVKINVTVPNAPNVANITLAANSPFIDVNTEAVLFVSDITDLVQDGTAILSISDGVSILPLESPRGYNVRANQLVNCAEKKCGGLKENNTLPIRVVIATDPARFVCLTPLKRNNINRPATTAGTATGTGINLD